MKVLEETLERTGAASVDSHIKKLLDQSSLFGLLPASITDGLEKRFSTLSFSLGESVIRRGEPADAFYVIYSGKARLVDDSTGKPVTLATLGQGDSFGEESLLYKRPASYAVRASGNLILLKLSEADFDALIAQFPEIRTEIEERARRNVEFHFLKTLNILSSLTPKEVHELLQSVETIRLKQGEFLFHEGDPGDAIYIIRTGRIQIIKESSAGALLSVLKPGALLGEMSLLYSQPRSAAAVADNDSQVLRLKHEVFTWIASKSPNVRDLIARQATNCLLRERAILESGESPSVEHLEGPALKKSRVKAGQGLFAPTYSIVRAATPVLAGLACLSMINHFYGRRDESEQAVEQQLCNGQTDNLLTVSRKAEAGGYVTRLLLLDGTRLASAPCPAIVEQAGGLSVVFSVSKSEVLLANPLTGVERVSRNDFARTWDGRLLAVAYVPQFGSIGKQTRKIFKQFLPMMRPYRQLIVGILLVSLMIQLLALVGPLFSKVIIDDVLVHRDYSLLYLMLLGMGFVTAFHLASNALREYLIAHAFRRINTSLLLNFFKHIFSLPQRVFSKWSVGEFTLRVNENDKLLQLVSQAGAKVLVDSFTVLIYLFVLLSQNAKLTGVALIFVAAYGLTMAISLPLLRDNERRVFKSKTETESHIIEAVTGIDTIKALARENAFFKQGINLIVNTKQAEFKGALVGFNIEMIGGAINNASTVVILGYGATLALKGELTTGELVAFTATLGLLLTPLMGLVKSWDELQQIRVSLERINDVLELPPEKQDDTAVLPAIEGHVRFENLGFRYDEGGKDILSDINLEVSPGQKVALVGRSGSGKTTLANLMIKLLEPTGGKILIDHRDISNIELSSLRRQMGVVEQSPFLFGGTIRENIAKPDPGVSFERVVAAAMLAGAHEFIEKLPMGYETEIGERGITLSGGQRQRLVIARAILTNPRILILDEATAALDTESERIIQENLDKLMAARTTFIIAHRLSTVRNADQIVVLDQGRIVEAGKHEQLIEQRGLYFYLSTKSSVD